MTTVSEAEVGRFDRLAEDWWDPRGPMAPLHAMNPVRTAWVLRLLDRHGLRAGPVLDIGCGAGLLTEALARAGVPITGLDAAPAAIAAARRHAEGLNLPLGYEEGAVEDLAPGRLFAAVTAMEVIEHVPDPQIFVSALAARLVPGGLLMLSTLNRNLASLLVAKIGAEYVARLLPRGTHDWRRFLPPARLAALLCAAGLEVIGTAGLSYDPWRRRWSESRDLRINYMIAARKP